MTSTDIAGAEGDWLGRLARWCDDASWAIVVLVALGTGIVVTKSAYNGFRLPKEMLVRAAGILVVSLAVARALLAARPSVPRPRPALIVAMAAIVWTLIATLTSQNRALSEYSLLWVACCAAIFLAVYFGARDRSLALLHAILAAAVLNSLVCIAMRAGPANVMYTMLDNGRSTGLMGSSHDAAAYLVFPTIAAAALCRAVKRRRWLYALAAITCAIGLLTTQTFAAIGAVAAAAVAGALTTSRRRGVAAIITLVAVIAAGSVAIAIYRPLRERVKQRIDAVKTGQFDILLAGRATPFLAAWGMFVDHPLTGVGPGCFGFEYFPYKQRIEDRYPAFMASPVRTLNFGEAHSDHLQTLAVSGVPGYALMIAAVIILALCSKPLAETEKRDFRAVFAATAGLPLAVAFVVLTIAAFPLELAAPTVALLCLAATCLAWREADAAA